MVDIRNISELLFNHMEDKHSYPITKVKLAIQKYEAKLKEKLIADNTSKIEFDDLYNTPRSIQNELYEGFLQERENILKEWTHSKSKDLLNKLITMRFNFKDIPEIYTTTVIKPYNERFKRPEPMEPMEPMDIPEQAIKKLKKCPPGKVLNPATNICVSPNSRVLKKKQPQPVSGDHVGDIKTEKPSKVPKTTKIIADSKATKKVPSPIVPLHESNNDMPEDTDLYGIINMGNSCYINSGIQMLFHNDKLNKIILSSESENKVIKAYIELYNSYMEKNIDKDQILNLVSELNNVIKNKEDKFNVKKQNDSSEFVNKLTEVFSDEIGDVFSKYTNVTIATSITFPDNIVIDDKNIKCLDVKKPDITPGKNIIIPLNNTNTDIADHLDAMVKGIPENITDEDNYYRCLKYKINGKNAKISDGEMRIPFTKTERLMTIPDSLNITLGVFGEDLISKNKSNITIPNKLKIKDQNYLIKGIVVHYGRTMKSGHYTYLSYQNNKWYEYSDDDIESYDMLTKEGGSNVFKANMKYPTPYMIHYEKI